MISYNCVKTYRTYAGCCPNAIEQPLDSVENPDVQIAQIESVQHDQYCNDTRAWNWRQTQAEDGSCDDDESVFANVNTL